MLLDRPAVASLLQTNRRCAGGVFAFVDYVNEMIGIVVSRKYVVDHAILGVEISLQAMSILSNDRIRTSILCLYLYVKYNPTNVKQVPIRPNSNWAKVSRSMTLSGRVSEAGRNGQHLKSEFACSMCFNVLVAHVPVPSGRRDCRDTATLISR